MTPYEMFPVGTRIQADDDRGVVIAHEDGTLQSWAPATTVYVAWESGVRTWTPVDLLTTSGECREAWLRGRRDALAEDRLDRDTEWDND